MSDSVETPKKNDQTGGMKNTKPEQLHAIPWEALAELGRVYAHGGEKYDDPDAGDYNFRTSQSSQLVQTC